MTFRKLPDKDKEGLTAAKAMKLMLAQPSMIKRPVLDLGGGKLLVGFKPELYEDAVAARRNSRYPLDPAAFRLPNAPHE